MAAWALAVLVFLIVRRTLLAQRPSNLSFCHTGSAAAQREELPES
jgi:hypothetical protein